MLLKSAMAELRLGCKNGWKVWLNGEMLFGRDEYHRGMKLDQYKLPIHLKKGKNSILIKCCQNEQTEQWTVEWQFQIRACRRHWHRYSPCRIRHFNPSI